MKAMKQSLFEKFEIKGYWWLPESDEEVPGILFYSQEDIYLELLGELKLEDDFFPRSSTHEIILGRSDKGEEFTLLDTKTKNSTATFPGYTTESYHIGSFLVGGLFNTKKVLNFHSAIFNLTYLTKWINRPVFVDETSYEKGSNNLIKKQVTYNETPRFNYYVPYIKSTIEESYLLNFGGDLSESVSWKHNRSVKIFPDDWQGFGWFYENMFLLKDLFSLFIGHGLYFQDIKFYGEEYTTDSSSYRKTYKYFFRQNKIKIKSNFNWSDIMVDFKEVEKDFSNIINTWFEKHQVLQTVYEFYFSNFYKEIYIDTTFLNTVQTLEIYHRKTFKGKIFDKAVYRDLSTQLKDHINDHFPADFSKKINGMLAFGNEFTLAMRLDEILNNFEPETKDRLIGDSAAVNKFIRQIVDTRNYLTHYDTNKKKNVLEDIDEKFLTIKRLTAITTVILFKEIGINESLILNKVCESKQYSYVLAKAKKVLI